MTNESRAHPRLDEESIRMFVIEAVGGDQALIQDLVQSYLESAGKLVEDLPRALNREDWTLLQRSAHSLKSSSKMFGLQTVAQKCAAVEERAHVAHRDELAILVDQIVAEIREMQEILPEYCDRLLETTKSNVS